LDLLRKGKGMTNKRLYFVPIIARALTSDNPKKAMDDAFDEIRELGNQPEYKEGFHQFIEFVKATVKPSGEESEQGIQLTRNAIYRLIYDLATDSFEGERAEREALISTLRSISEWNAEYERIKGEARAFLAPETPIEVEVVKEDQIIGSSLIAADPSTISPISPGRYTLRFSNGRILWEGNLTKEDVIWSFAFPEKDLAMAAESEPHQQEPTRTISLLDGEFVMQIFAGLESGEIRLKSGQKN